MTTEQKAFFELVRAGLWGTAADPAVFSAETNWTNLYGHGRRQAMLGILLDGIRSLPEALRPGRALYLQWCASVLQIEEQNKKINHEIGKLYTLLRSQGVNPILLKGQGAARNYPAPLHRQCGDIDLYIGKARFEQVNRLLRQDGVETHEASVKHSHFEWNGVIVENHRILAKMRAPGANRILQHKIAAWHESGMAESFNLDGCEVNVPPAAFDVLFLLQHAVNHLMTSGIGVRQICDWACLLHGRKKAIRQENVAEDLRRLGLDKAARIIGAFAVRYMGLPADDLPLPFDKNDESLCEFLLDEIWTGGNFGKEDPRKTPRPDGYWSGKWHTFRTVLRRQLRFREIAPSEAAWMPYSLTRDFLRAQRALRLRKRKRKEPLPAEQT